MIAFNQFDDNEEDIEEEEFDEESDDIEDDENNEESFEDGDRNRFGPQERLILFN